MLQLEVSPVCWQVHVGLCPPRTNPLFYYKVTESYISAGTWGGQLGITCLPVNSCIQCSYMNLTNVRERSWVGGELAGYVNRNVISTSAQLNVGARHCNNIITTGYKLKPDWLKLNAINNRHSFSICISQTSSSSLQHDTKFSILRIVRRRQSILNPSFEAELCAEPCSLPASCYRPV